MVLGHCTLKKVGVAWLRYSRCHVGVLEALPERYTRTIYGKLSHRDLRPCVARTLLASGTITCALSVETNSFVRGAFVEAGTRFFPPSWEKCPVLTTSRTACVSLVVTVFVLIDTAVDE